MIQAFTVGAAAIGLLGWLVWSAITAPPAKVAPLSKDERARVTCEAYIAERHQYSKVDAHEAVWLGEGPKHPWRGRIGPIDLTGPEWLANGDGVQYVVGYSDVWDAEYLLNTEKSREFFWRCTFTDDGTVDHVKTCVLDQPPGRTASGFHKHPAY